MPDWLALLLFVFVPACAVAGIHLVFRRFVPPESLLPHHDVAGFLVAIVGVLYAVVMGFLVVTVWASFQSVQSDADVEAFGLGDAYGFAGALPEPQRTRIRHDLGEYAVRVATVEWASLANGKPDPQAHTVLLQAFRELNRVRAPKDPSFYAALRLQIIVENELKSLRQVWDHRRLRLTDARTHLAPALYLAIVLGGLMVLTFVFLFGVEHGTVQVIMTGLVAGCIGLLFGLVVEFNQPYGGLIRVNADAWHYVIHTMHPSPPPK